MTDHQQAWEALRQELLALDQWGDFDPRTFQAQWQPKQAPHPVDVLASVGVPEEHYETYLPVLLRALDDPDVARGVVFVFRRMSRAGRTVRAAIKPGMTVAVDKLIKLFSDEAVLQDLRFLMWIADAIYDIEPRSHLGECLRICRDQRLGDARHRLILHLSRFKKSEEVFQTLISLLDEEFPFVRGAALEALKRFGDVRAIPAIERTPVRDGADGIYESHQKLMALKKLNEKKHKL